MIWRNCVVESIRTNWPGATVVDATVVAAPENAEIHPVGTQLRALAYPKLTGEVEVGDLVRTESQALARGLGTGGFAFIAAILNRIPPDPPPAPGHLVKARYLPTQYLVAGVDDQESHHHTTICAAESLAGMPVVVAELHSTLPAIIAAISADRPTARIAYVWTDTAALPVWFSRNVAALQASGAIVGTISCGQAFGGDLEAVTVHNALLAARHILEADIAIVAQGPGNLGTSTKWGFSGLATGEAINAVGTLGGQPVAVLRVSGADSRTRHRGISHHSETILADVVRVPVKVPIPVLDTADAETARILATAENLTWGQASWESVPVADLSAVLSTGPVPLSTMGRSFRDDPLPFLFAAAAGRYGASLIPWPEDAN